MYLLAETVCELDGNKFCNNVLDLDADLLKYVILNQFLLVISGMMVHMWVDAFRWC